jgi:hypothetical protein
MAGIREKGHSSRKQDESSVEVCVSSVTLHSPYLNHAHDECHISVAGRGVPLLHLHGEIAGRAPVSALLQAVLLPVHSQVAHGDQVAVSALQGFAAPARAGQLPVGGGCHPAARQPASHGREQFRRRRFS